MRLKGQQEWAMVTAFAVFWMFTMPRSANAQDHVVRPSELHRQLVSTAQARATNVADVERVLSLPAAQDLLRKSNVNQDRLHKAISLLSDEELSRLADRARVAEQDVEGGFLVGILALIGLVVVILVVLTVVNKSD